MTTINKEIKLEITPEKIKEAIDYAFSLNLLKSVEWAPERQQLTSSEHILGKDQFDRDRRDHVRQILGSIYEDIINILKQYSDLREDYYNLVALWIIGTYIHDEFQTYPYLFINAMRGSGKTRLIKLIKALSNNGKMVTSLREAVLFRTAKGSTLCIDEFENIGSKDNQALRELLNACYKKGIKVERMKKVRTVSGDEMQVEAFEPYTPIAMANIWGMEEVLGDRCITIVLEKSSDQRITRLVEDFDSLPEISMVKSGFSAILVYLCSYFGVFTYEKQWNNYINQRYNYTTTYNTYNTLKYTKFTNLTVSEELDIKISKVTEIKNLELFNKIYDTGINGRNLELMLPLFFIADFLSEEALNNILQIAKNITKEKKENEVIESKDVMLIDYISQFGLKRDYQTIKELTANFRHYVGDDEGEERWINTHWVGRALKRLSLLKEKRRMKDGYEVIPDVDKAIEKIKIFK